MTTAIPIDTTPEERPTFRWTLLGRMLSSVRHAASGDACRFTLNSVLLELESVDGSDTDTVKATATDGHRLAQASASVPRGALELPARGFLLTLDDTDRIIGEAKRAAKASGKHRPAEGICTLSDGALLLSSVPASGEIVCRPVDGEFPNYRQVMPKADREQQTIAFSPVYLGECARAAKGIGTRGVRVRIALGSEGSLCPAVFESSDGEGLELSEVVMPMRL